MNSLRSYSILFVIVITFLLAMSIFTYISLNNFRSDAKWVNHTSIVLKDLEGILSSVKDAQTAHRGYELTGDSSFLKPYNDIRGTIFNKIEDVDSLLLDHEGQRKKLDSLKKLIERQFSITDEILTRRKSESGLDRYGMNLIVFDEENMIKIRQLVLNMSTAEEQILRERTSEQNRSGVVAPVFLLISFISATTALSYLFLQLFKTIKVKNATEYELEQNLKLLSEEVNQKELAQHSLQKVLDSSTNGILFLRSIRENGQIVDFEYIMANKGIKNIIDYSPDQIVGKSLLTLFPGADEKGLYEDYKEVVDEGKVLDREFYYDHEKINAWFHVTATKLEDGCVVTFSNITQRKMFEEDILVKNQELEESNKNLEQFAYVASHDLQEPLRKIRAFGDRIVNKYNDIVDDKGKDYIARMNGAAERMQLLIDDLLKYSRVARNPKEFERIDIQKIINNISVDFETVINERNAVIKTSGLAAVDGDKTQLRQLFQNLISNAIKFTPEDKKPVIQITGKKVRGSSQKDFKINSAKLFLRVEVQDNGIGFDQKYAERIFHIFERLHGKYKFKGTGIGLAICQKVVQNHNGFIRAESSLDGGGAKFIIMLPIKRT